MRTTAAVVETTGGPFVLNDVEVDGPGPGVVLVKSTATGFCHTDEIARHGDFPFGLPGVLGHEGASVAAAVGDGVTAVSEGQGVILGWPWCGECRSCLEGKPRYCLRLGELVGSRHRLGGSLSLKTSGLGPLASHFFSQSSFAGYSVTSANALVPVPVELVGPLACGLATGAGAVFNTGGRGGARRCDGGPLLGRHHHHRRRPERVAAGARRHPRVDAGDTDPVRAIGDICGGPADVSLEFTGIISVVRQAIDSVGMRGRCVLIGGAPAGIGHTTDHLSTLWRKTVRGTLGAAVAAPASSVRSSTCTCRAGSRSTGSWRRSRSAALRTRRRGRAPVRCSSRCW